MIVAPSALASAGEGRRGLRALKDRRQLTLGERRPIIWVLTGISRLGAIKKS